MEVVAEVEDVKEAAAADDVVEVVVDDAAGKIISSVLLGLN